MLGYVLISERGGAQALFAELVPQLRAQSIGLAGAVQVTVDQPGDRPAMYLQILSDGQRIKISQDLGPQATGCRLDPGALEETVGRVSNDIRHGQVDLLLINKFGKQEAAGAGFIAAIELAMDQGIRCLITVPAHLKDQFDNWSQGEATQILPTDILEWANP